MASRLAEPRCVSGDYGIPDAVIIVPLHESTGKLVLIKEFRVPIGDYQYGFPAGLVDPGESLSDATKRELKEETGLEMLKMNCEGPPVYSSSGLSDESVSMVYVTCEGEPSRKYNESSEDIETVLVTPEEAEEILKNRDLKIDVKTYLVALGFAKTGKVIW